MDESLFTGTLKGGATRQESAALRALARARRDHTHARFVHALDNGIVFGICEGSHGEEYEVHPGLCSCLAGQNGMMCRHRAALLDIVGRLDLLIPDFYGRFVPPAVCEPLSAA